MPRGYSEAETRRRRGCLVDIPARRSKGHRRRPPSLGRLLVEAGARRYVAAARTVRVEIGDEGASGLEDQFVAARATGKIAPKDAERRLHQWVGLAKLLAKSSGATVLAPEHWNRAFDLEAERARRLAERDRGMPPPPPRAPPPPQRVAAGSEA